MQIIKQLREAVHRKRPALWPNDWILHHDIATAHKMLSVKQFLAKKSITEMEHPPYSPDLVPNDFWFFPKIKSALKGRRLQNTENIKKRDDDTESCSPRLPKMFPTVAVSLD
jgi:transposase